MPRYSLRFCLISVLTILSSSGRCTTAQAAPPGGHPRLLVLVYFDQLRGDYLSRWEALFGAGGFRRLQDDGAWFQNCHYPYAYTVTAVGHSSVATGCSPDKHGIVGNDWYDRSVGKMVGCVASDRYARVPPRLSDSEPWKETAGVSPQRLLQPTIADALKAATGGKARVVSLSIKDRSAVLPGGRQPDACYWFDARAGEFVTSTYYTERVHPWVAAYNRRQVADQWLDRQWERLRPDLDYQRYSGPDEVREEGTGSFQGRTFPHPFSGGPKRQKPAYYEAVVTSPFGNEVLLGLAQAAIEAEGLGTHSVPDLLSVSFSSNDLVGHAWGPDSQEVLDVTLRSDQIVRALLATLDTKVGRDRYVLVLTADHGVCPLPSVSRVQGRDAQRVAPALLGAQAEAFLNERFGKPQTSRWIEAVAGLWVYLNDRTAASHGVSIDTVAAALADWLTQQPGIAKVYPRSQLLRGVAADDAMGQQVRRSFYPERCGDLFVVLKPYYLLSSAVGVGTTHGTPYPYDTHVPLLVYGPGIRKGRHRELVRPQAAAAILAHALGIAPPAGAEAPVPEGLFAPPAP